MPLMREFPAKRVLVIRQTCQWIAKVFGVPRTVKLSEFQLMAERKLVDVPERHTLLPYRHPLPAVVLA